MEFSLWNRKQSGYKLRLQTMITSQAPATDITARSYASVVSKAAGKSLVLFLLPLLVAAATAARAQTVPDDFDPNGNDEIHVVVIQPDGKVILGGQFSTLAPNGGATVTRNRIARLN